MKKFLLVSVLLIMSSSIYAGEGGVSNYIPGFYGDLALAVEPPEGLSIRNDIFYYSADGGRMVRSGQIEIDAEMTLTYNYLTFLYNPGMEVLGAQVAFGVTSSIGQVDIDATLQAGGLSVNANDKSTGLGDTVLAANFYWNKDEFNFAWANYMVTPTGSYDADDLANTGLNYWTFETDLMATYLDMEKGRDYSIVVGYGYNTKNDDTDYKTGDEAHIDVVLNQFLTESFGVGVNGFIFRQLSGDSGDGALLGDFKGEASGIGPAMYYIRKIAGSDVYFSAKWLKEFDVKNRLKGDYVYASFALSF